jgi:hypothetical protein
VIAQEKSYRQLGMRDRILNLPLMVAAVLTLIWRDVAGVTELTRMLNREGFLWCEPKQVTQQALSQRFLTFPAEIFESIFKGLLPEFERRWHSRKQRPLPESIQFARTKFARIWAGDVHLITRLNNKASFTVERVFTNSYSIRDRIVVMGAGNQKTPCINMRLVEIRLGKSWYSYLTSVLDPLILPPCLVALFTAGNPPKEARQDKV